MAARITKISVNKAQIQSTLRKKAGKAAIKKSRSIAASTIETKTKIFIENVKNHPVTQEIENGPLAANISATLGYGNLFSFIGFEESEKPIEKLISFLKRNIKLNKNPKLKSKRNQILYEFTVKVPSLDDIAAVTPLPWESARSWVVGIERGISGLGNYLFSRTRNFKNSKSGTAIQTKRGKMRKGRFKNRPYMSKLINEYIKSLKSSANIL